MPNPTQIIFLHGQESGPFGSKYHSLVQAFPEQVLSPDFSGQTLEQRFATAQNYIETLSAPLFLVGSSLGGLLAVLLADALPKRFEGLLLLAPALHLPEADQAYKNPSHCTVLAALKDEIIPANAIQNWCQQRAVHLHWADDDHRLSQSHARIIALLRQELKN
jgi:alpha-beta hydrolase superfamily lysophospholipase